MEVEAKFTIPDQDTIKRLKSIVRLGPFVFAPGQPDFHRVQDRYFDTPERTLAQNYYACRIRRQDGQRIVTVKGLGDVDDAIHQRFESEFVLADQVDVENIDVTSIHPQTWPESEARDLILSLVKDEPLHKLFAVEQERTVRYLVENGRTIAQLSIDQVIIQSHQRQQSFWVLEVEVMPKGTIDQLHILANHLRQTWGLEAERRSKFDLGMALLVQSESENQEILDQLSSAERAQLEYITKHADDLLLQDRAQLILEYQNNAPVRKLAVQLGRSKSWAYEWIARFRENRMGVFPVELLALAQDPDQNLDPNGEPALSLLALADASPPNREGMSVSEMCNRFQVDIAHAQCVAEHALALFDALEPIHQLGVDRRKLLHVMGMLHNVGLESDPIRHHIAGRDIILDNPLRELSKVEQHMLAAAVFLHRKKFKPRRLKAKAVASLPPGIQQDTLALAALVRIADGLDYSQSQTTTLDTIQPALSPLRVSVSGPYASVDAARAEAKADLWEHRFGIPVVFLDEQANPSSSDNQETGEQVPAGRESGLGEQAIPAHEPGPLPLQEPVSPGILPDEAMSEAGRKVLYLHFWRMIEKQTATQEGTDIEALHDMRVATRRMRSAFQLFSPYFKKDAIRPHLVGLRRTAQVLGQVRDLDVLMEKARHYLETLPPENAQDIDPLLQAWEKQRDKARAKMISHLQDTKYQDFVRDFRRFLTTPGEGSRKVKGFPPKPYQVRHVAPRLIYTRWEHVQAFDTVLEGASISILHALRIDCKRLRYTLEFFREVLGEEAQEVIAHVVRLQDHLGNLNDADVANKILSDFLFSRQDALGSSIIAPGVVAYLAFKQRELQNLLQTFPQVWQEFNQSGVRYSLARAVAAL
ncbi:MAG: CHAD domain-containing protein [Anaerolineae bacterium]|nr:CHAD domain-containing protein [Anaerolineae bacterium]